MVGGASTALLGYGNRETDEKGQSAQVLDTSLDGPLFYMHEQPLPR